MIITTAGRATIELITKAKQLASTYKVPYCERNCVSIDTMKQMHRDDVLVVGKERIYISPQHNDEKVFFHPNLAMVRAKRLLKGEEEPLITTAKLKEGMSFLDCTLGLASDSIIASLVVGPTGTVTGLEGNDQLYLLVNEGLSTFSSGIKQFDEAMRKINVIYNDHFSFLQKMESNSVDVVYFDPMFHTAIDTSHGINSIRTQALTTEINTETIKEAKRVARERVVLKDHWKSARFSQLGFTQHKRKTALFHYGTIEL
ncbi:class I SAM-dependent methyltransferase [Ornithinibacillus halophilus]|uniref:Putative SAM-dependent methyltransferase n=1 Tax=Ornithinibacillus halophilus TaxID=930117 RepID=A0A1M5JWX6_9BACI|nr:class I SAM-dependent methyltransferase [Ornithinibacillus halophilus]SHG45051.1 Putative SAM-dependent methyltransferase [Ornithinibacillus halophilus]